MILSSDRTRSIRTLGMMLLALWTAVSTGCTRPRTDIVAATTEDVGAYDLQARITDQGLVATVCVANARSTDEIITRIVQQLANHNYASMTFDVYSADRAIARYVWTRAGQRREGTAEPRNPCHGRESAQPSGPSAGAAE
jgi:hypothetical protein